MLRWRIAILISAAIAISYLDRQTLPVAIGEIRKDILISNQVKAFLDSAFLLTYGLMYVGGGRLMDILGTRRGFLIIMIFWSVACASHGFAGGVFMLAASRLLLGVGEGGGFPAATRAVAEWFPVKERSTAMGIINAGTGLGGILAPPLIAWVITNVTWLGISPWRWVFFITGALGLLWTIWWAREYFPPEKHRKITGAERAIIRATQPRSAELHSAVSQISNLRAAAKREDATSAEASAECNSAIQQIENLRYTPDKPPPKVPIAELLRFRETWGVVCAKFLTDAAWYFYMFWLPKYLLDARGFNIKGVGSVAWIPFAAAALGCLVGGGLSSWLLHRGYSVNAARKIALGLSAAVMPCVMLVPHVSVSWVIFLFSVAFFGQQSWSTLVMILPTDLFPKHALGTVAGFVGLGGALGGVVLGQLAGYLLDHGFSYTPVLIIAGSLHVAAFSLILATVRTMNPLPLKPQYLAAST
jgi:ACS family hexuronate transporter-like MFS transporter